MWLSFNTPIWFYPHPVDFRKQMDGLVMFIADHLKMNPASGQLFLFRSRARNKLKIVWWDRNGFWLFYRRFGKGFFKFPEPGKQALELTRDQFTWLLSGLDYVKHPTLPEITPINFL